MVVLRNVMGYPSENAGETGNDASAACRSGQTGTDQASLTLQYVLRSKGEKSADEWELFLSKWEFNGMVSYEITGKSVGK